MGLKYDILNKTFTNKKGYVFTVTKLAGKTANSIQLYECVFESGWTTIASSGHIRSGEVKDNLSPSVFGVGMLGTAEGFAKRHESRRIYYTWRNMIRRCYDKTHNKYKWYGGIGVTVCERWHRLDYFIEDLPFIEGYDQIKFENSEIELDKDIKGRGTKEYNKDVCMFVTRHENVEEALKNRWHGNKSVSTIPQGST